MSDIIQLLPDSVANQIAAGEVIQRPASVIKELVENAVDAGAKNIHVIVVDAGRTSIQVIDDGKGMSETDARLSFERHATSKIRKADDLFALHTMGFRGEALASIAAVAQIELKTRRPDDELGTSLTISAGKFTNQEACSCAVGSNFKVENLFFNVPARRKFLKSNSTELNHIIAAFERIVLVYPDVAFTLHSNDSEVFNLRRGSLKQRIVDVFGKRLNQDLLPVDVETSMCDIHGFVGKPESARKKGVYQYFFVNGRYMKHPYFAKAVQTAFERLVPMGEQVPYFIYFQVNPEDIDVNIHPTKTEIKFENEQPIWQILMAAVKESVGMFNDIPAIDFDTEGRPDIPVFTQNHQVEVPKVQYNPNYNPFKTEKSITTPSQWEDLYQGLSQPHEEDVFASQQSEEATMESSNDNVMAEKSPIHYQYKGKYIMTAVKSGLMIIDQYRAHIRILFEQYMRQLQTRHALSQKVLFPQTVQLSTVESLTLDKIQDDLDGMGFELSALGGNSYAVNAIPAELEGVDITILLKEMVVAAMEKPIDMRTDLHEVLALVMARKAAIPYGQVLSNDEMESVVNNLFACQNASYTPDGKNVLCILKQSEIELLLK
ncbi:DNA mismatch repair protein [Prevotella sp. DNF00663]|uniref:DNA mismatch repair endonuclease MutL n=1 Tax=unclassified Prevotella TaxID=2638335 RepID=UPI0005139DEB|nr:MULTISPECIES: DNA mismatch repair endonuclease MutL [unclassified Prevotella]KGI60452.1 DNA mismatch repair protein MutL [Prevotella sp. S7 MS 2]KXB78843.1 DNA mismatch repair protein [Prevotella sp. DNF00663]